MRFWKIVTAFCFVIVLMALPMMTACGGDNGETPTSGPTGPAEVTITIGNITDKTGPASSAMEPVDMVLKDLVRYFNENDLIPNVTLKVLEYDTEYNPARDIPGYEWLMNRGADFVYGGLPSTPIALKSKVNKDEVVMFASSGLSEVGDPPGWIFTINPAFADVGQSYLNWIAENHWDYEANGPARVGMLTWATPAYEEFMQGFEQYVEAHPEQFEWEGKFMEDAGTFIWDNQANELKNADYVFLPGAGLVPAAKALRDYGSEAKFLLSDSHTGFLGMVRDAGLVEAFDGSLWALPCRWWNDDTSIVNLAKQMLVDYHGQSELEKQMALGGNYVTTAHMLKGMLDAVRQTVEDVGAENFSSQALYDTLIGFTADYGEGYEPWGWTETSRYGYDYFRIYQFDKTQNDLVNTDDEWHPFIQ
ncbi:MAG: ABC transporter substrate-binding protein [Dehalococcoidia bacterium]